MSIREILSNFFSEIYNIVISISDVYWNIMIILLLATGVYFTYVTGFVQKHICKGFSYLKGSAKDSRGIPAFQALCTSVASRVGIGNMAGVAVAIQTGGPGALLWMWLTSILGMSTAYSESLLAQIYKRKSKDSSGKSYIGGPAFYILHGLNMKSLSVTFSILFIITFGYVFQSMQANTLASITSETFDIPVAYIAVSLTLVTFVIFNLGVSQLSTLASYIVPFMALLYVLVTLIIVFMNIQEIPRVFALIFSSAFSLNAGAGGFLGGMYAAMLNGVKRGLFSNEAGMGSAPNIAAASKPDPHHPSTQGCVQMISVAVDTLLVCTCTAIVIILFTDTHNTQSNGILLTQDAFASQMGLFGYIFVAISITLFTFTSLLGNYAYVEGNIKFIKKGSKNILFFIRVTSCIIIFLSCFLDTPKIWNIGDFFMAILATANIFALLCLSKVVRDVTKDFNSDIKKYGNDINFRKQDYPKIKGIADDIWV